MPSLLLTLGTGRELMFEDCDEGLLCSVDAMMKEAADEGYWPSECLAVEQDDGVNHYINTLGVSHVVVVHGRSDPERLVSEEPRHPAQKAKGELRSAFEIWSDR